MLGEMAIQFRMELYFAYYNIMSARLGVFRLFGMFSSIFLLSGRVVKTFVVNESFNFVKRSRGSFETVCVFKEFIRTTVFYSLVDGTFTRYMCR